jgi:hypothetical protein
MPITLRELGPELDASIEAGNAVMIESPSGIGKSQKIYQSYERFKARHEAAGKKVGFGQIFAATQTPPDLIGFQFKGEREFVIGQDAEGKDIHKRVTVTDPSVPLWMLSTEGKPAFMYDKFYLFIDEYGQGEPDVKRAIAEIFLNGGTSPWYLPPGSVRVSATNRGARYGVTKDFDFCISRRTLLQVVGDAKVWIEDFADHPYWHQGRQWKVMSVIKAWAESNSSVLFESEPEKQGPWCNPRAITAVDRYLQVKWGPNGEKCKPSDSTTIENVAGTIGMPATAALMAHFQFKLQLPSYDTVVSDPKGTPVPSKADMMLLMIYELAGLVQPDDLAQVITYVERFGAKDMAITFVSTLLRRDYKSFTTLPAMAAWISRNSGLLSVVQALATN